MGGLVQEWEGAVGKMDYGEDVMTVLARVLFVATDDADEDA